MSFVPHFTLYESDGNTLAYLFPVVQETNAPQTVATSNTVTGVRGKGGIIIPGPDAIWELTIRFILMDVDYTAITAKIDALESAIPLFTRFVLEIDKNISGDVYSYDVQRTKPIEYSNSLRTNFQEVLIRFNVNTW